MALVVIVAILSAPLMTTMGKKSTIVYGEYKCYARLVDNKWVLFQNERVNTDVYPAQDAALDEDEPCRFTRPAGNVSSYTVTIYGGGGSGSMPYFESANAEGIKFAEGQNGSSGEKKHVVDSLNKAFDTNEIMSIYFCDKNSTKNCIGKGGEINKSKSSKAPEERIKKIKKNLENNGSLSASDKDYINNACCSLAKSRLWSYESNPNSAKKSLINSLSLTCCNLLPDNSKYTGNSGQSSKIILSNGQYATASGGTYGVSDKLLNSKIYSVSDFTTAGNDLYYMPVTANPDISQGKFTNCNGDDANNPRDIDIFENFGIGGGGGVFACKIKNTGNLTTLNGNVGYSTYNIVYQGTDNQCYMGFGGAGAGGAIIVQWN